MNASDAERSPYDEFAWIYSKYWGPGAVALEMPILDRLLLKHVPAGSKILDVCCGTGQIASVLIDRGYRVAGVDSSEMMLFYASENAPLAELIQADARTFEVKEQCDAAISTLESFNHIMALDDLKAVFQSVHKALKPDALFYFDMNTEEGLREKWNGEMKMQDEGRICHIRMGFSQETGLGRMHITVSRADGSVPPQEFDIFERCYSTNDVWQALKEAGFTDITVYHSNRDLNIDPIGIEYYVCKKSDTHATRSAFCSC